MPNRPRLPGRLLVFRIGGTAKAPEFPVQVPPPIELTGVTSAGDVAHGFALFHQNCQVCHGPNASGAWLPDLKRSPMLMTADNWKGVVIDGAQASRGMASFKRFFTPRTPRTSAPTCCRRPQGAGGRGGPAGPDRDALGGDWR
jgi:mono/diheme cytochrome c family protein